MAWVRIDDQAPRHQKMLHAGPAACWLWVCGIAHSQSQLTDGFISDEVLPMIGVTGTPRTKRLAESLVKVGLFDRVAGGYLVHDYLDHNQSKVAVIEKRADDSERKRKGEERRESERRPPTDSARTPPGIPPESAAPRARLPSHPIPSEKKERIEHALAPPKDSADPNVKIFLQWFPEEYKAKRHGADYCVKWQRDAPLVKTLLKATTFERLQNCARILLSDKLEEPWIVDTDRGIGVLSAKFNWLSDRLASWEARQKAQT